MDAIVTNKTVTVFVESHVIPRVAYTRTAQLYVANGRVTMTGSRTYTAQDETGKPVVAHEFPLVDVKSQAEMDEFDAALQETAGECW